MVAAEARPRRCCLRYPLEVIPLVFLLIFVSPVGLHSMFFAVAFVSAGFGWLFVGRRGEALAMAMSRIVLVVAISIIWGAEAPTAFALVVLSLATLQPVVSAIALAAAILRNAPAAHTAP